jgi:hypothetical protein
MKTNLRNMSPEQLNETKGGYYVNIILPDGTVVRVRV